MKTHDVGVGSDQPAGNVIPFPINAKLVRAKRAYDAECERVDRLEYAGKKPRFNERIKTAYFAALFEGRFGRDAGDHSPI